MIKETLSNGNIVEITPISKTINIKTSIINRGEDNQKTVFNIFGRLKTNQAVNIATLKVSAKQDSRILNAPSIRKDLQQRLFNNKSFLKLKFKSLDKDSEQNIVSYTYDLIYTAKESIKESTKLKYNFDFKTKEVVEKRTPKQGVDKISFGNTEMNSSGGSRKISIYGVPNSMFRLAITKRIDASDKTIEKNILVLRPGSASQYNKSVPYNISDNDKILLEGKLNSKGVYHFNQRFGKNENTYAGTGDEYIISIDSAFISSKFEKLNWLTDRTGWDGYHYKVIYQRPDPVLTLKVLTDLGAGLADLKINDGDVRTWNSSAAASHTYSGLYMVKNNYGNTFDIKYRARALSGAHWTKKSGAGGGGNGVLGDPKFSNVDQTKSDWTNSVQSGDSEMRVRIQVVSSTISTTSVTNDTYTLELKLHVEHWGYKSKTMELQTGDIILRN
tara:strand:+ start:14077 stop:15408 length:1332 start_codon:yes stop_codon:yes gene_type:complete